MKKRFLTRPLSPGFKIPQSAATMIPDPATTTEEGLAELRTAVERLKGESQRAEHPLLGQLSRAESDAFQLRHAEMHMSFHLPEEG